MKIIVALALSLVAFIGTGARNVAADANIPAQYEIKTFPKVKISNDLRMCGKRRFRKYLLGVNLSPPSRSKVSRSSRRLYGRGIATLRGPTLRDASRNVRQDLKVSFSTAETLSRKGKVIRSATRLSMAKVFSLRKRVQGYFYISFTAPTASTKSTYGLITFYAVRGSKPAHCGFRQQVQVSVLSQQE